jgi:hypothetical protein
LIDLTRDRVMALVDAGRLSPGSVGLNSSLTSDDLTRCPVLKGARLAVEHLGADGAWSILQPFPLGRSILVSDPYRTTMIVTRN